ncbi:MAG: type II toxin-antitoxin system PemK/MazF family toxin [Coriobacteriales bacterium]|nr:type II toxin-antitoxin system PemK/MazF family toxin [Coriobacteriales bacterium]
MNPLLEQGDLIELDFDPTKDHEPAKRRSALVVSVNYFNNILSGLTVVCPITSVANGHPLHIALSSDGLVGGYICVEQIRAVDLKRRNCAPVGERLDADTMAQVLEAIGAVFGI